jgi:alkylhydroperoxidase/carboxymuconolactone decarboxylase family protein YurZ
LVRAIVAHAARIDTMPTDQEKLDYLDEIVRTRGYAHGSHRLLANHDLDALKAVNEITLANYIPARSLSTTDKELLLVGAFTALRSAPVIIRAHVQKSLQAGADLRQSLAAIELTLLEAGRSALDAGLGAWREVAAAAGAPQQAPRPHPNESPTMSGTILDQHDPAVGAALARLSAVIDHGARGLDDRTRELVMTIILMCVRATDERIEAQMRRALAAGASDRDLLEAIELIITPAGLPVFDAGLAVWARVTGATPLEPTIDAPHSRAPAARK